jgi:hypothetical protein
VVVVVMGVVAVAASSERKRERGVSSPLIEGKEEEDTRSKDGQRERATYPSPPPVNHSLFRRF